MVYTLRFFPLQNAVCFIILSYLVPVLFAFYIQGVLKLKKIILGPKGKGGYISFLVINVCNHGKYYETSSIHPQSHSTQYDDDYCYYYYYHYCFNPPNAELNPICHLLALLRGHHILHVSRARVNVS